MLNVKARNTSDSVRFWVVVSWESVTASGPTLLIQTNSQHVMLIRFYWYNIQDWAWLFDVLIPNQLTQVISTYLLLKKHKIFKNLDYCLFFISMYLFKWSNSKIVYLYIAVPSRFLFFFLIIFKTREISWVFIFPS